MNIIITHETNVAAHDHHHEGHHHADDVFTSWGTETPNKYDKADT